jgi:hypothetical protein
MIQCNKYANFYTTSLALKSGLIQLNACWINPMTQNNQDMHP